MWQDVNICWSHHDVRTACGKLEVEQNPVKIVAHRPWQKHTLAACKQTPHPLLQSSKILSCALHWPVQNGQSNSSRGRGRQIRLFPQHLQPLSPQTQCWLMVRRASSNLALSKGNVKNSVELFDAALPASNWCNAWGPAWYHHQPLQESSENNVLPISHLNLFCMPFDSSWISQFQDFGNGLEFTVSVQLQNELQCRPVASLRPSLRSSLLLYRQHSFDARDLCIKVAPLDNRLNRPCVSFSRIPSFGPPWNWWIRLLLHITVDLFIASEADEKKLGEDSDLFITRYSLNESTGKYSIISWVKTCFKQRSNTVLLGEACFTSLFQPI